MESTSSENTRLKTVIKRLLAILWGLFIALLVLEVFLRVGFDMLPRGTQGVVQHVRRVPWDEEHIIPVLPFITSRETQARLPPGLKDYVVHWGDTKFKFDTISLWDGAEGFRTNPPQWPVDVVALGDSFTFCWTDFEDCWVERLHSDFNWSVMNLGIPGTGSLSHQMLIAPYVVPMEPQVVVWQWFGNDFKDDYDHARIRGEIELLPGPPTAAETVPDFGALADYSATYRLLRDWLYRREHPETDQNFYPKVNGRELMVSPLLGSHDLKYKAVQYGWERSIQAIEEAHRTVYDELDAELVIVLIPTKEETYADYITEELGEEYLQMLTVGRQRLLNVCDKKGWRCVDVTEALQQAVAEGQTVYNAFDFHLDAAGNKIVSEVLGQYLIEHNLLDDRR